MQDWLAQMRVIICAGAGGVGKTTMAAALGIAAARSGRRVMVLTIDPAKRLASALGLSSTAGEVRQVSIPGVDPLMSATMIDAQKVFADFVARTAPSEEVVARLNKNRLFQELTSTLSGSQEFTSLEKLLQVSEEEKFDLVILDTPPAQNAVDFLRAPERLFALFQESVLKWFINEEGGSPLQRIFQRGTRTALSYLEKITGAVFISELSDFFANVSSLRDRVAERSIAAHRLLSSPTTSFVLVTAPDDAKFKDALEFAQDLQRSGHQLAAVIVNRAQPIWLEGLPNVDGEWSSADESLQRINALWLKAREFYGNQLRHYQQLLQRLHGQLQVIPVAEMSTPVAGITNLVELSAELQTRMKQEKE